jgi:hypothetical protein
MLSLHARARTIRTEEDSSHAVLLPEPQSKIASIQVDTPNSLGVTDTFHHVRLQER